MYWTDQHSKQVLRGNKDGSGSVVELFSTADYLNVPGDGFPLGIAVDNSSIYWTDSGSEQILQGSIDGTGSVTELFDAGDYPGSPLNLKPHYLVVEVPEPVSLLSVVWGGVLILATRRRMRQVR